MQDNATRRQHTHYVTAPHHDTRLDRHFAQICQRLADLQHAGESTLLRARGPKKPQRAWKRFTCDSAHPSARSAAPRITSAAPPQQRAAPYIGLLEKPVPLNRDRQGALLPARGCKNAR